MDPSHQEVETREGDPGYTLVNVFSNVVSTVVDIIMPGRNERSVQRFFIDDDYPHVYDDPVYESRNAAGDLRRTPLTRTPTTRTPRTRGSRRRDPESRRHNINPHARTPRRILMTGGNTPDVEMPRVDKNKILTILAYTRDASRLHELDDIQIPSDVMNDAFDHVRRNDEKLFVIKYIVEKHGFRPSSTYLTETSPEITEYFIEKFPSILQEPGMAYSIVTHLLGYSQYGESSVELVSKFIDLGMDANAHHDYGYDNILAFAVSKGNVDLVKYLLSKGADPKRDNNAAFKQTIEFAYKYIPIAVEIQEQLVKALGSSVTDEEIKEILMVFDRAQRPYPTNIMLQEFIDECAKPPVRKNVEILRDEMRLVF